MELISVWKCSIAKLIAEDVPQKPAGKTVPSSACYIDMEAKGALELYWFVSTLRGSAYGV